MSDNDLIKDNVVQFPGKKKEPSKEDDIKQDMSLAVESVEKDINSSMSTLTRKCNNFEHRKCITKEKGDTPENSISENDVRDIEQAVQKIHTTLGAICKLMDMVRHDLVESMQDSEKQGVALWQTSAHLQVLLSLLSDTGVIKEKEFEAKWVEATKGLRETIKKGKEEDPKKSE